MLLVVQYLQINVIRPAPAFGRDPIDDLVGIHNIASFAVDAVREIDFRLPAPVDLFDFIDGGGAEILAGISEFNRTAADADTEIENLQMGRLVFVVFGA